jgi:allophanate hydrolase
MGIRMDGRRIETRSGNDILSAGIVTGAVQVTPGQPILMLKDHATTGGYPLIAVVIGADLSRASQLKADDKVRFLRVTLEAAYQAMREMDEYLAA